MVVAKDAIREDRTPDRASRTRSTGPSRTTAPAELRPERRLLQVKRDPAPRVLPLLVLLVPQALLELPARAQPEREPAEREPAEREPAEREPAEREPAE